MNNEKFYLEIINNLCDGVYFVDTERRITFWNTAAAEITGYKEKEMTGRYCHDNLLDHIDENGIPLCSHGCPLYSSILDGRQRKARIFLRHKDGYRKPVYVNIFPMTENKKTIGAIEIFTANSSVVYDDSLIERLSDLALNDPLTGLANRRKIESYLDFRLSELKRFKNQFCVVFLDIDNFRLFNNTYGHDLGDEVLKSVSKSIMLSMRKTDMFGRWGGEEFLGIFEVLNNEEAIHIAEKLRVLIANTQIPYGGENLSVTVSLGVTKAVEGDTVDTVVKRADALMYQSKKNGKNCVTADM